jgi:hypothetical protein
MEGGDQVKRAPCVALLVVLVLAALGGFVLDVPKAVAAQEDGPLGKVLYLHNATNGNGAFLMNTSQPTGANVMEVNFTETTKTFGFFLDPVLAGDLRLNGTFLVLLWVKQVDSPGTTNFIDFSFDIWETDAAGTRLALLVDSPVTSYLDITTHYSEYAFGADLATSVAASQGNGLEIEITLESPSSNTKVVAWGSADFRSRAVVGAVDRIDVASVVLRNDTGGQPPYFDPADNVTVNATITDPFGGYDIVWANATLVAPDGAVVFDREPMALTSGNDTSFAKTFELRYVDPTKLKGVYTLTIEAVDRTGFHYRFPDRPGDETYGGHLETETVTFAVGQVLYANFLLRDAAGTPLEGARLILREGALVVADLVTDRFGRANASALPGVGDYVAEVWWQDVLVLSQTVTLDGNVDASDPVELVAAVFDPVFRVVDVAFAPLGDAAVYLTHPNGSTTRQPMTTDGDGRVALTQMAAGTYELRILWSGVAVGLTTVDVNASAAYEVVADVFYLTVAAADADGETVPSVHVVVQDRQRALVADSRLTDAGGRTVSRLPAGTYDVAASWFGVPVGGEENVTLAANRTVSLDLAIYTVTFAAVDERGVGLDGATVAVELGGFQISGQADFQGRATFKLPGGDLSVRVWWRDVLVYDRVETISASRTSVELAADVYYVALRAVDGNGNALAGVAVTLLRDGVAVDGGVTDANGTVEFRQPVGTYAVVARFETTYLLTPVDLTVEAAVTFPTASQPVNLAFETFPPPLTSTNVFPVLILLGIQIVAAFLLWWKLLRKGEVAAPERPSEEGEPPGPEEPPAGEQPPQEEE